MKSASSDSVRSLSPSSSKRLLQYGLGVGAAAAAAGGALPDAAQGAIVYTPGLLTSTTLYFDLNPTAGSTTTLSSSPFASADFSLRDNGYPSANGTKPIAATYGNNGTNAIACAIRGPNQFSYALRLSAGATINSASGFTSASFTYFNDTSSNGSNTGYNLGDWHPGDSGYIGLRLQNSNTGVSGPFYGWAFVTLNAYSANSGEFTVNGFAYETAADQAIIAGAVPEPNSAMLLIAGAGGLVALRARRRKANADTEPAAAELPAA